MKICWRREWQPTPVFLPEKSRGQSRSLAGYIQSTGSQRVRHDWVTNTYSIVGNFQKHLICDYFVLYVYILTTLKIFYFIYLYALGLGWGTWDLWSSLHHVRCLLAPSGIFLSWRTQSSLSHSGSSSSARDATQAPWLGPWNLGHWTARQGPSYYIFTQVWLTFQGIFIHTLSNHVVHLIPHSPSTYCVIAFLSTTNLKFKWYNILKGRNVTPDTFLLISIIQEPVLEKKPHKDVGNSVQHADILKKKKGLQVSA